MLIQKSKSNVHTNHLPVIRNVQKPPLRKESHFYLSCCRKPKHIHSIKSNSFDVCMKI